MKFSKELRELYNEIKELGIDVFVSGSGPTMYVVDPTMEVILKIKDVIKDIQTIQIDNTNASKIKNGNIIPNKYNTNMCLFIDEQNNEIAIYQTTQDKLYLKPYKML